jgi:NADH-quinone oxidoreductase subunit M
MNAINNSILTLILLLPLAGAALVMLAPDREKLPNWIALGTALATFGLTLHLSAHFILGQRGFQFEVNRLWIELSPNAVESHGIFYHVGVDGLSLWLVVLVGLLAPVGVVASWNAIQERRKLFFALFLVQQTAMLGVFISLDLILYYGFWELSLVPVAILIAMYGRKDGPRAALKFFLFTFIPSAPLLVAILWLYTKTGSFDFATLQLWITSGSLPAGALWWVALAFLFAFAVKVPVFPLHGWLADTFSEAPVALAMVVAGKLGLYSMLRFHIGLFPAQARAVAPLLVGLAVVGILYGACLALVQRDFWRLMAFAALSHLSLITLGIYGLTLTGWEGAVYQILNHGVVDGALFLLLGVLYDSYSTSQISAYGGLAAKLPRTATFFVIASLAMIGLPILNGFVGEFLILLGTFTGVSKGWAMAAALGVILGAAYMLWLVQRIFFGPESGLATSKPPEDVGAGRLAVLWPLAVLMLVMGVAPMLWLPTIEAGPHPQSIELKSSEKHGAGAKAPDLFAALPARLKSCPDTSGGSDKGYSSACKAPAESMNGEGQR